MRITPVEQLSLFPEPLKKPRPETLVMGADALVKWKSQVFNYQQRVMETKPSQQTTLFDLTPTHTEPDKIDPFSLQVRSLSFWEYPTDSSGDACIYFVIDSKLPLLLYIGETCRSNKRWKGVHDCKSYISHYHDLHYKYGLQRAINIAFWWDTPTERKARQDLELGLILRWKSPFNKENWERWGQPFGK